MTLSRSISTSIRAANVWRSLVIPGLVATVSLAAAFIGAVLIGGDSGIDGVNGFVESLSGQSGTFLGDLGLLAPLGFAFAAGMVAAVNPCGFAMLPAYMGLYLGANDTDDGGRHLFKHLGKALLVGGTVTAGAPSATGWEGPAE